MAKISDCINFNFYLFIFFNVSSLKLSTSSFLKFLLGGFLISIHWYLFFYSIKISSISLTLSILSTASLMTSFLEPIFYKRPFKIYELLFGFVAVLGLLLIFGTQSENYLAITLSLICTLLSVLFSLLNGHLVQKYSSIQISFMNLFLVLLIISSIIISSEYKFSKLYLIKSSRVDLYLYFRIIMYCVCICSIYLYSKIYNTLYYDDVFKS